MFSRDSRTIAEGHGAGSWTIAGSTVRTKVYTCLLHGTEVSRTSPGPLACGAAVHSSHEALLSAGGCYINVAEGADKNVGKFNSTMMLMSLL